MEKDPAYYYGLITRYLSGEASEMEIRRLHKWIKADDANRREFDVHRKAWMAVERNNLSKNVDLDAEWAAIQHRMHIEEEQEVERVPLIPFIRQRLARRKKRGPALRIAALMLILIGVSMVFIIHNRPSQKILVAENGISSQRLSDGSEVSLNSGSKLSYPSYFKGNTRMVALEGEACFTVSHDTAKPFILSAGNTRIKVLGTSFYVNTHNKNGNVEVVLASGKVLIYTEETPSETAVLAPGDKAEVNESRHEISKTVNTDLNYDSWRTLKLVFNDQSLSEIVEVLKRTYHTDIQIDNKALGNCRITASFEKQPLESVLKVVAATLNLKVGKAGQRIVISGNSCN